MQDISKTKCQSKYSRDKVTKNLKIYKLEYQVKVCFKKKIFEENWKSHKMNQE